MFLSDCFIFAQLYFPASGYLIQVGGGCNGVGIHSSIWSSSSAGTLNCSPSYLGIDVSVIRPMSDMSGRGFGRSVRCVQVFIVFFCSKYKNVESVAIN